MEVGDGPSSMSLTHHVGKRDSTLALHRLIPSPAHSWPEGMGETGPLW